MTPSVLPNVHRRVSVSTKQPRINVVVGQRLHEASVRVARRQGLPVSAYLRSLLVRELLAAGDITEADLEHDDTATAKEDG
jgi:hypothetical protein